MFDKILNTPLDEKIQENTKILGIINNRQV